MVLASTGCSAYSQALKLMKDYEPAVEEEAIEEVELPDEEEIPDEDILNEDELYYTIPDDYMCTYSCEYFNSFDNGDYQATLYEKQDDELERFLDGETDTYMDIRRQL